MAKKIVITSGKGGVGKTTVTANLGVNLSKVGFRVALVDLDFGLNNLDVVLGLENDVLYDLSDVFSGRCRVKQALIQHKLYPNLFILPSDKLKGYSNINGQNVKLILEKLTDIFDYILIDCPAGIDIGFHRAISCVDQAFVVATPNSTSLRDADKVISIVKSYNLDYLGLIINRVRGDLILDKKMMLPTDVQELLKVDLLGIIPEEDEIFLSLCGRLNKKTDCYKAYKTLAENVVTGRRKMFDATSKYSGFFGSIRRGLKKSIWERSLMN